MMNLALNVQLTDEQYAELMKTSYEKIFESQDFLQELSKVVATEIGSYLQKNPSIIKESLGINVGWYESNKEREENRKLLTKVIMDASTGVSSEISDAVKDTIKDILRKTDMQNIIETVITRAILTGMGSGIREHFEAVNNVFMGVNSDIDDLKNRLNNL